MPFTFKKSALADVVIIEPKVFLDGRGFFTERYKASEFVEHGIKTVFTQVNQSRSQKHVLRGLHYQLNPKAQDKLMIVLRGEIFDVVVDIRKGSPTYGRWIGEHLSESNKKMLYVPCGFAHGFCVLSDEAEIMYYCSNEYAPDLERSILWNDPAINIIWPVSQPLLSSKDICGQLMHDADNNFVYEKGAF
ncbi:MAG: dTDP-4-dehydrorhamnose 3,5-epimerase [Candidatus Omnitrophica bacterium]|nr:dTDP-4-dehydrorhamnose 3,5-epimerase [Candidatus Omnitrophota bacterium]